MMISTKGRYALRIMADVAQHDGEMPVSVREIAQPAGYFRKIYGTDHQRADPKRSFAQRRGAQGGYHLAKRPADITVGMILRATEGESCAGRVRFDGWACLHAKRRLSVPCRICQGIQRHQQRH